MGRDTLSDVLQTVRLKGAIYFYVNGAHEWAAESPASSEIAAAVMPGAEHVMQYHVVTSGRCWAGIVGQSPVQLSAGDAVVVPHGDAHVMSSAPGMRGSPLRRCAAGGRIGLARRPARPVRRARARAVARAAGRGLVDRRARAPGGTVALEVGYDSEAAFARVFKREVGTSPAAWRRALRGAV